MTRTAMIPPPVGRLGLVAFVEPTVHAVLAERLGLAPGTLAPRIALGDDLAADSLDLLEVVIDLESIFTIVVPERDVDRIRTVADLVHVIAKYVWERDHPEPFEREIHVAA